MTSTSSRPRSLLRRAVVAAATLGATAAITLVGADAAQAAPKHQPQRTWPSSIALPDGFRPEGIAIRGTRVYTGSLANGDIYAANLRTGRGRVLSSGPGTPSVGLRVDGPRLWVAGGPTGSGRVVDTRSGKLLASFTLTTEQPTFVNDVALAGRYAWFTDSARPQLYRVDRRHPEGTPVTVPLTGEWQQVAGKTNANGITRAPGGNALLVVNSATGQLFRVDLTGKATVVDLGGYQLTNGDGLLLRGQTLYVVQNQLNRVAVVRLDRQGTSGRVVRTIDSPAFDVPSTVARHGRYLYLPNARFGATDPNAITYSIVRVRA